MEKLCGKAKRNQMKQSQVYDRGPTLTTTQLIYFVSVSKPITHEKILVPGYSPDHPSIHSQSKGRFREKYRLAFPISVCLSRT